MSLLGTYGSIEIARQASMADLKALSISGPDQEDFKAFRRGDLVVVVQHDGHERLYHREYLEILNGKAVVAEALEKGGR